ncbi:MAG: ion transporter [Acidobacteriota bacterium]
MRRVLDALIQERVVVTVIIVNALAILVLGRGEDEAQLDAWAFWVDYACVLYFLIEAIIKLHRDGRTYFKSGWNVFDFLVLLFSLPVLITPWVPLHQFDLVPVLRIGRLFRLFRMLRFIPNRDHLVDGIGRALKASVGVFLALFLVNVILAVLATLLFGELAPEHFGNPIMAAYSIFKVFTLEGWYEIPDLLSERAKDPVWAVIARLYFVGAVMIGGILGLSLANAVFVDEMMMDNTEDLERKIDQLNDEVGGLREQLDTLIRLAEESGVSGELGDSKSIGSERIGDF